MLFKFHEKCLINFYIVWIMDCG